MIPTAAPDHLLLTIQSSKCSQVPTLSLRFASAHCRNPPAKEVSPVAVIRVPPTGASMQAAFTSAASNALYNP